MSAPATTNDFLTIVRKSGLFDEVAFAGQYHTEEMLPDDPQQCASELVRAGLLTSFQAKTLLSGKYKGFLLGPYKVLQPIGKGGMGVVYLAEHTSLKRRVAVKILPKEYAEDKLALERFFREARAAAALDHPNIVGIHDITQGAGTHFLVMEYVEGVTLDELIAKTGRLHYAQAIDYVAQAAAGLAHAHAKGFVHRDIKPANLMVTRDGKVKILDMGLARSFENAADNLTAHLGDGGVAGTADFVSPEQALNDPVDARSDIYSLGATLYALIAGRPPFSGNTSQKLLQHQLTEPPRLSKTNATVPAEISDIVAVMMAKDPTDRFQSIDEVIDALTPWLPAAPASSTAVGLSMSTKELKAALTSKRLQPAGGTKTSRSFTTPSTSRRKPLLMGSAVAAVLLAVIGYSLISGDNDLAKGVAVPAGPAPVIAPPPPKPIPGVLARVSWETARVQVLPLQNVQKSTAFQPPVLPRPWAAVTSRTGMTGELEVLDEDGTRIISLRNVSRNTPGIRLDSEDTLCTLKANLKYRVTVDYRTEPGVRAWVEARYSTDPRNVISRTTLPATAGSWATANLDLEPKVEMPLYLTFCNDGRNTERLFLRKIDVTVARTRGGSGPFTPIPLDDLATVCTTGPLFGQGTQIDLEDWGPRTIEGVPFQLVDPSGGAKNALLFHCRQGSLAPKMPRSITVPIRSRAAAIHVLGGVSSWGWPFGGNDPARGVPKGTTSLAVTISYADGRTETVEWRNGIEITDNSFATNAEARNVTGSKPAIETKNKRQVRYLAVVPNRAETIESLTFAKGPDDEVTAPMIFGLTVEKPAVAAGAFRMLSLEGVATASTADRLFSASNTQMPDFGEWGPKEFKGVPFFVIDPEGGKKNLILLNGSQGQAPPTMPKQVVVPVNSRVTAVHVLGGVSGWGWPYANDPSNGNRGAPAGTVSVIARVRYADGTTEDHEWRNGEHLCDYSIGNNAARFEGMTGSVLAFELKGKRQVRYLVLRPSKTDVVKEIEFVKGPHDHWTAPMIMAVTAETAAGGEK